MKGKGRRWSLGMGCCDYVYFSLVYTTGRVLVMTPLKIGTHVNVLLVRVQRSCEKVVLSLSNGSALP